MAKKKCPHKKHPLRPVRREDYRPPADRPEGATIAERGYWPGWNFSEQEIEFMKAVQRWQKKHRSKFLSHSAYLRIALELGYHRDPTPETTMTPTEVTPPVPATVLGGLPIRDQIAALALPGILAAHSHDVAMPAAEEAAGMACRYADALLAAMKANPAA